jgi:four helix bundle protein
MSLANFRTYQLSIQFYREVLPLRLPSHLRDQLLRATSSITLNLAEGSAKGTLPDRLRFYRISLGSQRECAAILALLPEPHAAISSLCDQLGAHVYKLVHSPRA